MTQRKPVQCNNGVLCKSPCSAPYPPPLSAPRRHAVGRGTKRRGRWARPRIAGRRPQKVRVVPIQCTHRRSRKRSKRATTTHPDLRQRRCPVGDVDVGARKKAQQGSQVGNKGSDFWGRSWTAGGRARSGWTVEPRSDIPRGGRAQLRLVRAKMAISERRRARRAARVDKAVRTSPCGGVTPSLERRKPTFPTPLRPGAPGSCGGNASGVRRRWTRPRSGAPNHSLGAPPPLPFGGCLGGSLGVCLGGSLGVLGCTPARSASRRVRKPCSSLTYSP